MHLPRSIRGRLALLVLTVLVPIFCLTLVTALKVYRDTQTAVSNVALQAAKALSLVVERELAVRSTVLKTLASSSALVRVDLETFHREAHNVVPTIENTIVLVDPSGQQRINTRVPYGSQPLSRTTSFKVGAGPEVSVSDLYMAPIGKSHSFAVRIPVVVDGQAKWHLAMGSFASQLQEIYRQQTLPQTWVSTVLDAQGKVVARSKNTERFVGKSATPDMLARIKASREGVHESHTLEGDPVVTAFSRVPGTNWSVLIGIPKSENQVAARNAFAFVMGGSTLVTLACLWVAARVARTLAEPVHRLEAHGIALGRGDPVQYEPTGLAETDAVSRALAKASSALQQADETSKARVAAAVWETENAQRAALAAQKLEALGRLTGSIAHDFNNLMQTMVTSLTLLERTCPDGRSKSALGACQRAVQRATQLTRQLMAFGRAQPGNQASIEVARYLTETESLLKGALKGSTRLILDLAPDLYPVKTDPVQLELAVLNLVMNARDALKAAGTIEIKADNRTFEGDNPFSLSAGDYVAITVSDDGEGIAPEHLPRIFEPFFTTKPLGEGTGLGLAQVYAFAKQQNGAASVSSTPGNGTAVTILLPRGKAAPPDGDNVAVETAPPSRHVGQVLFVEDDSLIRGVVSEALEEAGFQVVVAANAEDALAVARSRPDLDAVLSDVVMPGGQSGLELARALRTLRPTLPVILASGYTEATAGADVDFPVLAKPYDLAEVSRRLTSAIRTCRQATP